MISDWPARAIGATIASASFLVLASIVFIKRRDRPSNRYFAYSNFGLAIWNFGELFILFVNDRPHYAVMLDRLSYIGATGFIAFFLKMVYSFIDTVSPRKRTMQLIQNIFIVASTVMSGLLCTPLIVKSLRPPMDEVPGPLFAMFGIYFISGIGLGLLQLLQGYRRSSAVEKNRLKYFILAIGMGTIASVNFFLTFAFPSFPPMYHPFEILYGLITAYCILNRNLMDIRLLLRDTSVYIATGLVLGGVSLIVSYPFSDAFPHVAPFVGISTMGLLMAFAYDPIRRMVQPAIDRLVFADRFSYLQELAHLPNDMLEFTNMRELLKFLVTRLTSAGKLTHAAVYMYAPTQQAFTLSIQHQNPERASSTPLIDPQWTLGQDSPLAKLLTTDNRLWVKEAVMESANPIAAPALLELNRLGAGSYFGVMNKDELVGIVILGSKVTGEAFNQNDLKILRALKMRLENFLLQAMVTTQESLNMVKDSHDMKNDVNALSGRLSMKRYRIKTMEQTLNCKLQALVDGIASGSLGKELLLVQLSEMRTNVAAASQEQQALLPVEEDALQRLSNKLQNWSVYGRLVEGGFQGTRRMEAIDLSGACKMCVERWRPAAVRKNIALSLDLGDNLNVMGERSLVEQILDNLVDNGIKATEVGSVTLSCQRVDRQILIKVQDTGCGIPEDHLSMIFKKPFYQGKGRETLEKSTGVGLVLVGQYVKSLNGTVRVESQDGKGSTFFVSLPAAERASQAA